VKRAWQGIVGSKFSAEGFGEYCRDLILADWIPQFCVIHNTGDPTFAQWHDVAGTVRMLGLASYYRDDQKWSAGPHLFVADDGLWVFTPLSVPGVHSPSWNAVSWGMEIVGDYDHEPLRDDVKANVISALASLHRLAGWAEPKIKLHKDDPLTAHTYCPGVNVNRVELECGITTLLDLDK
jgi:hypothetical protein